MVLCIVLRRKRGLLKGFFTHIQKMSADSFRFVSAISLAAPINEGQKSCRERGFACFRSVFPRSVCFSFQQNLKILLEGRFNNSIGCCYHHQLFNSKKSCFVCNFGQILQYPWVQANTAGTAKSPVVGVNQSGGEFKTQRKQLKELLN